MDLTALYNLICDRQQHPQPGSYTSALFESGLPRMAQKVGEEGTEVVVAALSQGDDRLVEEIADLTYHTLVLMAARGLKPQDVLNELERRHRR